MNDDAPDSLGTRLACVDRLVTACETLVAELTALETHSTGRIETRRAAWPTA